jgi:HSP20 family protein
MRYRKSTIRYTAVVRSGYVWPLGELWQGSRLQPLPTARWRPDADLHETATSIEIVVDVAGIEEDDFDVSIFEDVVVVEGERKLPSFLGSTVYHTAAIPYGPFQVELPLPGPVDVKGVEARYEQGLLRITLPKQREQS